MKNSIPKIVHYCWMSDDEWDLKTKDCFFSWKKFIPDYEFMLWNRYTLPKEVLNTPTVINAINSKKWAFVADYVRIWALTTYGGVYMDLDVELLKKIDELLIYNVVFGLEGKRIGGHFIASKKQHPFLLFVLDELKDKTNFMPLPHFLSECYQNYYSIEIDEMISFDLAIFPNDYFNPFLWDTETKKGVLSVTDRTYCIHWYAGGWIPKYKKTFVYKMLISVLEKVQILPLIRKIRGY